MNNLEWDIFYEMMDQFESESKKKGKTDNIQPRIAQPSKLQGETEKEKIMSMNKSSIRTVKSGRTKRH